MEKVGRESGEENEGAVKGWEMERRRKRWRARCQRDKESDGAEAERSQKEEEADGRTHICKSRASIRPSVPPSVSSPPRRVVRSRCVRDSHSSFIEI